MNTQPSPFGNPGFGSIFSVITEQAGRMQRVRQQLQDMHLTRPGKQVDPANDFPLENSVGPIIQAIPKEGHGLSEASTRLAVNPIHIQVDRG